MMDFGYHKPDDYGLMPHISIGGNYHTSVDQCNHCGREWIGNRRLLGHGLRAVCELCDRRKREGLVQYRPSNGTEMDIFQSRCRDCRHCSEHPDGYDVCAWKILDRLYIAGWEPRDSPTSWFDPAELQTRAEGGRPMCPALCLRFTDRNDPDGERRDPVPYDPDQMTFEDVLEVPEPAPGLIDGVSAAGDPAELWLEDSPVMPGGAA